MLNRLPVPLLIAGVGLLILPPILLALGLTVTSATEIVVFALACMALNILVGHTGLVSFGHGAWFGLAAYAAALIQRNWMPNSFVGPTLLALVMVAITAAAFGYLILRRRGVYFSLLTLALAAMLYSVSFRWTDVTGGENGLGGITRPALLGFDLDAGATYYWFVALIAFLVLILLWRFHNSTVGSVLVAIRENEQRARFLGYPTNRYKLAAFVLSAGITGLARSGELRRGMWDVVHCPHQEQVTDHVTGVESTSRLRLCQIQGHFILLLRYGYLLGYVDFASCLACQHCIDLVQLRLPALQHVLRMLPLPDQASCFGHPFLVQRHVHLPGHPVSSAPRSASRPGS